jgi:hypothetical protein
VIVGCAEARDPLRIAAASGALVAVLPTVGRLASSGDISFVMGGTQFDSALCAVLMAELCLRRQQATGMCRMRVRIAVGAPPLLLGWRGAARTLPTSPFCRSACWRPIIATDRSLENKGLCAESAVSAKSESG